MEYDIAVIPGDGIGPEVVEAALPLFERAGGHEGVGFETTTYDWGSERYT